MDLVKRQYKISLNIGSFKYYGETIAFKLPQGPLTVITGVIISLLTICFGFLGFSIIDNFQGISNSLEALAINFKGGEDPDIVNNIPEYDSKVSFIYANTLGQTLKNVGIEDIDIIVDIQNLYFEESNSAYSDENINFIFSHLEELKIRKISRDNILDIFEAMKTYDLKNELPLKT